MLLRLTVFDQDENAQTCLYKTIPQQHSSLVTAYWSTHMPVYISHAMNCAFCACGGSAELRPQLLGAWFEIHAYKARKDSYRMIPVVGPSLGFVPPRPQRAPASAFVVPGKSPLPGSIVFRASLGFRGASSSRRCFRAPGSGPGMSPRVAVNELGSAAWDH